MSIKAKRAWAAAGTVALAAVVNVATGMLAQHWALAWWAATAVLVVVGGGLQAWLTVAPESADAQRVVRTTVHGSVRQSRAGPGEQAVTGSEVGGDLTQEQQARRD